jgi:hypothetical protein
LTRSAPEGVVHDLGAVGAEEHQVAVGGAGADEDLRDDVGRQELEDRRLQAFDALGLLVDLDVGKTLGAVDADEGGVVVDLLAREAAAARDAQRCHASVGQFGRRAEDLEVHRLHEVGEFRETPV